VELEEGVVGRVLFRMLADEFEGDKDETAADDRRIYPGKAPLGDAGIVELDVTLRLEGVTLAIVGDYASSARGVEKHKYCRHSSKLLLWEEASNDGYLGADDLARASRVASPCPKKRMTMMLITDNIEGHNCTES
jgi:hypothetical protein